MSTSTNRQRQYQEYEISEELAAGIHQLATQRGQCISEILSAVMQAGCRELANLGESKSDLPLEALQQQAAFNKASIFVAEVDPPDHQTDSREATKPNPLFFQGGSTGGEETVSV